MFQRLRKSPPVCFVISLLRFLSGTLKYSKEYVGDRVRMKNGEEFEIFRHVTVNQHSSETAGALFIIRFKFARLTYKVNEFISQFPMLLITGFPGFRKKMYAVNYANGYWQGIYQWESIEALEAYRKSFVLALMNKRALKNSVTFDIIDKQDLKTFIKINEVLL